MPGTTLRRASPGFWAISVLSMIWNAFGVYDYVMTNIRNPAYLAQFPAPVIDYIDEMPIWALIAWTLGVWGALAGSLLLLARSRQAVVAFGFSLAGLAVNTVREIVGSVPAQMTTPSGIAMSAVIWIGAVFLLWFAWRAWRRGVLR